MGRQAPLPLPANGRGREELGAAEWERTLGSPALLLDVIQKFPLSGGSLKSKTNRARSSGKR